MDNSHLYISALDLTRQVLLLIAWSENVPDYGVQLKSLILCMSYQYYELFCILDWEYPTLKPLLQSIIKLFFHGCYVTKVGPSFFLLWTDWWSNSRFFQFKLCVIYLDLQKSLRFWLNFFQKCINNVLYAHCIFKFCI